MPARPASPPSSEATGSSRLFTGQGRRRPFRKLVVLAAGLAIPAASFGGQVRGKLVGLEKLINPVWHEAKDVGSHRFSWREPSPTVRAEFRNLYAYAPKEVCVAALASSPQQPPALPLLITVGGGRTTPVTVVVTPGTRLHFENRDPFAHKLYGVGQSTFPPGEMAALAARDWTAPGPGRYEIRDELSPSVRSWVVVEPNVAAIAYPSVQGMFLIPQLAAGEYTLKAFFGGSPAGTPRTFVLGGAVVDIALPVAEGVTSRLDAGERD
jgi:hypothetical protein